MREDLEIAERLFKKLAIPFMISKRPDWDKFAGAFYSMGLDVLMPSGKTLQIGSVHQYKQNFSIPFEIKYEGVDGKHYYCHQTTYGMSERILGAIVGIHGDEKGIKLPSSIAPIQVVIIPILFKGVEEKIMEKCRELEEKFRSMGLRCHLDERDKTPGNKFYDWELKGVPMRVEIGPRDMEKGVITIAMRDGLKKSIPEHEVSKVIRELEQYDARLYENAEKYLQESIKRVEKLEEINAPIVEVPWCGSEECGLDMEEKTEMKSLGVPYPEEECQGKGAVCGKEAKSWLRMARTY